MHGPVARPGRAKGDARPRGRRTALILQGGGALGAYQAGAFEAMDAAGIMPDWVTGVSIGAINAALIAGNPPERRLPRLREFWHRVTARPPACPWPPVLESDGLRRIRSAQGAFGALLLGQPGFFTPRALNPWLAPRGAEGATAFYDTAPLRETLLELVDFELINARRIRFAVGAVNVRSGNFAWFDNADRTIGPEHIMASGALPPALPMVRVGADWYWDGGLVSNTPLQHLLDEEDERDTLVFQLDLFPAEGPLPRDMPDVLGREKEIRYSSRTRWNTDMHARLHRWKQELGRALEKVPESLLDAEQRRLKEELAALPSIVILHLIYRRQAWETSARDYEFSAETMRGHWQAGLLDARETLRQRDWLAPGNAKAGISTHDIHRDGG